MLRQTMASNYNDFAIFCLAILTDCTHLLPIRATQTMHRLKNKIIFFEQKI